MRKLLIALWLLSGAASAAAAEYMTVIDSTGLPEIQLEGLGIDPGTIGYSSATTVPGIWIDLNGDGIEDLVVRGSTDFCGSGGCQFFVLDGMSRKLLGSVFGSPLVVHSTKINGWPVLSIYSHGSASSGSYTTLVYDGQQYLKASSVYLYRESVTELFDKIRTDSAERARQ